MAIFQRMGTVINDDCFLDIVSRHLNRDLREPANRAQLDAVTHDKDTILKIVAGPGSGKTTVLVLRALRHVLIEGILPEEVLITTFTRKAAQELRTRWLDWGTSLMNVISQTQSVSHIDLNRCRIDTLDSIIHEVLTDFRPVGTLAPALADTSASLLIFKRRVFQDIYRKNKDDLDALLSRYSFDENTPRNQGEALRTTKRLLERLVQDKVDVVGYAKKGLAEKLIAHMLRAYKLQCTDTNVFDFSTLGEHFLLQLKNGILSEWTDCLRAVLVDEYQDTNPLQEAIYFSLMASSGISAAIVGDDDQSMYRFRGGSVELFTNFDDRCRQATGRHTSRIDMVRNFRSQPEIIDFFNSHISSDSDFQPARIYPAKPQVKPSKRGESIPVLGMFRPDEATLASDLAQFLLDLADRKLIAVGNNGQDIFLAEDGALGDVVFMSHSVQEIRYNHYGRTQQTLFPGQLREAMRRNGLDAFNPRGRALRSIRDVQVLLGLVLLSIDPASTIIEKVTPTNEAKYYLETWRKVAEEFVCTNPVPDDNQGLSGYLRDWQVVASGKQVGRIPQDWPVLELVFKLISWLPGFQKDPEHQVWLEAVTRIIASASMASPYRMVLLQNTSDRDHGNHVNLSRQSLVRDALIPIAEDEVNVDEDIMPSVPRNHLQFMTIHQAKGLEFPLVIVDVGSRFKSNHWKQRFLRFPRKASNVVQAENEVEPFLEAPIRGHREGLDRTFDDLVRLYYVAYSRPQCVLMLIGNEKGLTYGPRGAIPNIALGWNRGGTWPWRQGKTTSKPPVKVEPPFWEM